MRMLQRSQESQEPPLRAWERAAAPLRPRTPRRAGERERAARSRLRASAAGSPVAAAAAGGLARGDAISTRVANCSISLAGAGACPALMAVNKQTR